MSNQIASPDIKGLIDTEAPFGVHLSGKYKRSFAYATIKDRLPVILTGIIDNMSRNKESIIKKHGGNSSEELKHVIGHISKLRSELMTNKPLQPLELSNTDRDADAAIWNKQIQEQEIIDGAPPTWFNTYWLLSECYMYRRIAQIISSTQSLTSLDPFESQKEISFEHSLSSISLLARHIMSLLDEKTNNHSLSDQNKNLTQLLKLNLWGNRCDLSLSGGAESNAHGNPIERLSLFDEDLLIDNSQLVCNLLQDSKGRDVTVDIVLDNSGYELFTDLCVAAYLTALNFAKKIRIYVKRIPWFVSDVTERDFFWTIEYMNNSTDSSIRAFAQVCSNYLKNGKWSIQVESFWTEPFEFSKMKLQAPELYSKLSEAVLVIFKGDLNYRKLLGDINWKYSTDLITALREFNLTNIVSLRTLKADLVVGLPLEKVEQLRNKDKAWMTTGQYGVIQTTIPPHVVDVLN